MERYSVYQDIAARTGGDIYLGVVGPVRTGKSTFIKRFVELMLLPEIENEAFAKRAKDELPQSAAGRTIMTTEPKFVPEQAVTVSMEDGGEFRARLIDCVGYMVKGAMGQAEAGRPRMVKSPWFEDEVAFDLAAETGTKKVICEHSTVGVVMTTDGSISDLPRSAYEEAEERVIEQLQEIQKPFVILLNCVRPDSLEAMTLADELSEKYQKPVMPISCVDMTQETILEILRRLLYEFPIREVGLAVPSWVTMLEKDHWLQKSVYHAVQQYAQELDVMADLQTAQMECEYVQSASVKSMALGTGSAVMEVTLIPDLFYRILSETTGLEISDEAGLMPCVIELAKIKEKYDKIASALEQVNATGYGIVMPGMDELKLEEPEIMHQGGRYGVRLRASAPSIHMLRADISTEVAPVVGSERQSEELVSSLLADFEEDPVKIWQSNIFGKSLHELVNEGLQNKLLHMPADARSRIQETVERVINEGCSGLICIIL